MKKYLTKLKTYDIINVEIKKGNEVKMEEVNGDKKEDSKMIKFNSSLELNQIKNYFNNLFNVDFINLLIKRNERQKINKFIDKYEKKENSALLGGIYIKYIIYIKDNNKKIFKNKIIKKSVFLSGDILEKNKNIDDINERIGFIIINSIKDELSNYCIKKYLKKIKNIEKINEYTIKNNQFLLMYNDFLKLDLKK